MNILKLTDSEAQYLHRLVYRDDMELKNDKAYPAYTTLHEMLNKINAIMAKIDEVEDYYYEDIV